MANLFNIVLDFINDLHDAALSVVNIEKYPLADKWLHFFVVGVAGLVLFAYIHAALVWLSKYGIATISFVYTITIIFVLSLAIEMEQFITERGRVDLMDVVAGLCGFLFSFGVLFGVKMIRNRIAEKSNGAKDKEPDDSIGDVA